MSPDVAKVIQLAGLRPEDADARIVALAEHCLELRRYYSRAAEELRLRLGDRKTEA